MSPLSSHLYHRQRNRCSAMKKLLLYSVLFFFITSCNSAEYGIFSEVLEPKIITVNFDCKELDKRARLDSGVRITLRAGPRAEGVAYLRYVLLQVCLGAEEEAISSDGSDLPLINNCSDVYSERVIRGEELNRECQFIQFICMSSLTLPFDCNDFAEPRDSICYLKPNQKLKWKGSEIIPVVSKNKEPFLERSGRFWSEICCRYSSQFCRTDGDCRGKGGCQKYCLKSGVRCDKTGSCPSGDSCVGFCDGVGRTCSRDSDCSGGELCIKKRCRPALDLIALTGRLKDPNNFFSVERSSKGLRILCRSGEKWSGEAGLCCGR